MSSASIATLYASMRAARDGDDAAFRSLIETLQAGIQRVIRNMLASEGENADDERVAAIAGRVFGRARFELASKPDDWTTYDWFAWLARREVLRDMAERCVTCTSRS